MDSSQLSMLSIFHPLLQFAGFVVVRPHWMSYIVIDTGGKFATVVLTPVVHLDLRIDPIDIFRGLGEGDS